MKRDLLREAHDARRALRHGLQILGSILGVVRDLHAGRHDFHCDGFLNRLARFLHDQLDDLVLPLDQLID